jgi:type II secretory pathway pseudopilin PulG
MVDIVIVIVIVIGAALLALRLVRNQQAAALALRQGQQAAALKVASSKLVTNLSDRLSVGGCATHYLLSLKKGKQ